MKRWVGATFVCSATLILLGMLARADQSFYPESFYHSHFHAWFAGVGAGFENLLIQNRTDYLLEAPLTPTLPDIFVLSTAHNANGMFSVFVGRQWRPVLDARMNLFLEYDYFSSLPVSGTRYALNSASLSSPYVYDISHQALLFGAKANLADWHQLLPYVEIGVGVSQNELSGFANPASSLTINGFPNHVTYDLSYIMGMGLDISLQHNWLLSVGYRFGAWGEVDSGTVVTTTTGLTLAPIHLTNNLHSNQAMIKMSYVFAG